MCPSGTTGRPWGVLCVPERVGPALEKAPTFVDPAGLAPPEPPTGREGLENLEMTFEISAPSNFFFGELADHESRTVVPPIEQVPSITTWDYRVR